MFADVATFCTISALTLPRRGSTGDLRQAGLDDHLQELELSIAILTLRYALLNGVAQTNMQWTSLISQLQTFRNYGEVISLIEPRPFCIAANVLN